MEIFSDIEDYLKNVKKLDKRKTELIYNDIKLRKPQISIMGKIISKFAEMRIFDRDREYKEDVNFEKYSEILGRLFFSSKIHENIEKVVSYLDSPSHAYVELHNRVKDLKVVAKGVDGMFARIKLDGNDKIIGFKISEEFTFFENIVAKVCLNPLRENVPNFGYIYGTLYCSAPSIKNTSNNFCQSRANTSYIVSELIEGYGSLTSYTLDLSRFLELFVQILYSLDIAYEKGNKFCHLDLHSENILIRKLEKKMYIKYETENGIEYVYTDVIPVMIDYGQSQFVLTKEEIQKLGIKTNEDIIVYTEDAGVEYYVPRKQNLRQIDAIKLMNHFTIKVFDTKVPNYMKQVNEYTKSSNIKELLNLIKRKPTDNLDVINLEHDIAPMYMYFLPTGTYNFAEMIQNLSDNYNYLYCFDANGLTVDESYNHKDFCKYLRKVYPHINSIFTTVKNNEDVASCPDNPLCSRVIIEKNQTVTNLFEITDDEVLRSDFLKYYLEFVDKMEKDFSFLFYVYSQDYTNTIKVFSNYSTVKGYQDLFVKKIRDLKNGITDLSDVEIFVKELENIYDLLFSHKVAHDRLKYFKYCLEEFISLYKIKEASEIEKIIKNYYTLLMSISVIKLDEILKNITDTLTEMEKSIAVFVVPSSTFKGDENVKNIQKLVREVRTSVTKLERR